MNQPLSILGLPGSLRAASLNRGVLRALAARMPDDTTLTIYELRDLPLYDGDLDIEGGPASVNALKEAVAQADAVLFATPEYNYGVPGVLKNAIDWISRPAYRSVLAHKPVAIVSAASSPVGGARAQGQLKQILLGTVSDLLPSPELAIGQAQMRLTAEGDLLDEALEKSLSRLANDLVRFVLARK